MSFNAHFYEKDGAIWFYLEKASIAGHPAIPFIYDGPATERQKSFYKREYEAFQESKKKEVSEVEHIMVESSHPLLSEVA